MKLPVLTHPEQNDSKFKSVGISLAAHMDKSRENKEGKYAIRIRIIHNRIIKYYGTKMNMTVKEYQQIATGKPRNKLKEQSIIIYSMLMKANDIIVDMDKFSFAGFDKKFLNKTGAWNDVFFIFTKHIVELGKDNKIGTASTYSNTLKSLKSYHKRENLTFDEITVDWLKKYEKFMHTKSATTISIYTRCIRKLYNTAIKAGDANKDLYPFGAEKDGLYEPPQAQNIKKALPISDIKKIFEYEPEQGTLEHRSKDLWLFSYFCNGMNFADILRLKYSDIQGENIVFIRKKTGHKRKIKPIVVPLTDQIMNIIKLWGNEPTSDNYIFKILNKDMTEERIYSKVRQATKQCNNYMKKIAVKIGIDKNISTYYARHSYASVLKLSGANISYISESLGHSNLAVTENYLSSFDDNTRKENANKLTDW